MNGKRIFLLLMLSVASVLLFSKVKLPYILTDNMVLQQQSNVKLWGSAKQHAKISILTSWNNKKYSTEADASGKWLVAVETPSAGGPYDITFNDGEELTLSNILIGEVWLCSGQSNMEMPMKGFQGQPVEGSNRLIAAANETTPIRIYTTENKYSKTPMEDCEGKWSVHSSEGVANCSATAYYFGKFLQETLNVPVGLVISSWGGSRVEAWMSQSSMEAFPEFDLSYLSSEIVPKTPTNGTPCYLYNAKLYPLRDFSIKGVIWYQGESNKSDPALYARLMPAFAKDLRRTWGLGDIPFYYVQIAPYNYENPDETTAAYVREVQLQGMKTIPNSGMVVTLDAGDPVCIHPEKKQPVGERLAYWALANTYNKKGIGYNAPVYKAIEIKENKIYVSFEQSLSRSIAPINRSLNGFEIAGADRIFYPAEAKIERGRLGVWSEKVSTPVAVRYAYKNFATASIFDEFGLPISSFRSDDW